MKKILNYIITFTLMCTFVLLSGCTSDTTQSIAQDLDSTIKNLVISVSSLDWPTDDDLDTFTSMESALVQNNNSASAIDTQIDTTEIYTWLDNARSKINVLFSKRSDLLIYLNEIYGGNTNFSEEDFTSIRVYVNILKDNSNYLSNYTGMLKNQINEATSLYTDNSNINIINAYLIKAVETLQLRCAKIDTSVLAITSIIDIIKGNLINNYYDYNQHEINENNNDIILDTQDNTTEESESQNDNLNSNETLELNNDENLAENELTQNESLNNDNAINFDSPIVEVEVPQQNDPAPVIAETEQNVEIEQNIYSDNTATDNNSVTSNIADSAQNDTDYEIMTLEEPIIEDPIEQIQQNIETYYEDIDKEFTIDPSQEFESLDIRERDKDFAQGEPQVTREIIKEKIV